MCRHRLLIIQAGSFCAGICHYGKLGAQSLTGGCKLIQKVQMDLPEEV